MWRIPLKFQGYQRVRFFIWLALNQRLLTKVKLVRRGLDHDSACGVYGHGSEDVLYATRDCPTARNIWNHVIPSKWHTRFYARNLYEWLMLNLKIKYGWCLGDVD